MKFEIRSHLSNLFYRTFTGILKEYFRKILLHKFIFPRRKTTRMLFQSTQQLSLMDGVDQ